ncbi:glycosyltransferase family 9 protein [Niastella populi]|uniref:ADP-heptose--LPS heptosyltransferase n=1 Tax=Niastella populi TaxID=550983 RepID=A0A1V9GAF6_9BACT|nr:hypothetical protein [Niastella populi]OQP67534.1 hypothetical protein A4R26_33225 [Niastella populi]
MKNNLILDSFLKKISNNNCKRNDVKSVILLYEDPDAYIGDSFIRLLHLKPVRGFYQNARISLNYLKKDYTFIYSALLQNNPYLDELHQMQWAEIPFESYDVILCLTFDERELLEHLAMRYGQQISDGSFTPCVFSIFTKGAFRLSNIVPFIFPKHEELFAYSAQIMEQTGREIYITDEERHWGNTWLKDRGLQADEDLFIVVDAASQRHKLLDIAVYFEFLKYLLHKPKSKVLIFDENDIGKQDFYREFLEDELAARLIFSKENSLRLNICLMSTSQVKMVFGPCTGPMHCASGVYNNFVKNGMPREQVPLIIVYTGKNKLTTASFWWSTSPLVKCLLLRTTNKNVEMVLLTDLSGEERTRMDNQADCSRYTTEMLIDFVDRNLKLKA